MNLFRTKIKDCFELHNFYSSDVRGKFVKIFNSDEFLNFKLDLEIKEHYYSVSKKNVIRGLHFQLPPMDHIKLVYCLYGAVLDVVVDLRIGSPSYGNFELFQLSAEKANSIYIPKGMAHGFCALSEEAVLGYCVSSIYSQEYDCGIRWDSAKIPWPINLPIISERDLALPSFGEFRSPFIYED